MDKPIKKPKGRKKREIEPLDWDYLKTYEYLVQFDGSFSFNKTGFGYHIIDTKTGGEIHNFCNSINIPESSSNVGEYLALTAALNHINMWYTDTNIIILGDSKMIINQMNNIWNINDNKIYSQYALTCKELLEQSENRITLQWIKRELNERADQLSKCY